MPWIEYYDENRIFRYFDWNGNADDPLTQNTMEGVFEFRITNNSSIVGTGMYFELKDFGGPYNQFNQMFRHLDIKIGEHPTGIVPND